MITMYKRTIYFNHLGNGTEFSKKTKCATVVADTKERAIQKICNVAQVDKILIVKYDFEEIIN